MIQQSKFKMHIGRERVVNLTVKWKEEIDESKIIGELRQT